MTSMLRNYLLVTLRHIARHRGFSFINVSGLAVGMAAFVLIAMFIQNEWSFDRHHEKRDDVYRVILDAQVGEQSLLTASSPAVMAGAFIDAFPEVIDATRIETYPSDNLISVGDLSYYESGFFLADSSVFNLFTIPLIAGDPATALNRPNTIVLSESIALKYFGTVDPVGRSLRFDNRIEYEVTGVMPDPPTTSHFRPALMGSFLSNPQWTDDVWLNNQFVTYLLLRSGSDPEALRAKFPDFLRAQVGPQILRFTGQSYDDALAAGMRYDWHLERMADIYLHSRADDQIGDTGDIRYLYILGLIALFVLLIACINFMNLATARAAGRAREVGMRKVLGSERGQLVRQFLGESTATAFLSMILAFGLVVVALPAFENLTGSELHIAPWLIVAMTATALATGLVAGSYPAIVLSGFRPVVVLKGSFSGSKRGTALRSALVVFQFSITVALLAATAVVFKQLRFIQDQDLGFDEQQVVVVPIETRAGIEGFDTFRQELLSNASVVDAAAAGMLPGPGRIHNVTSFRTAAMSADQFFLAGLGEVSDDYVETLGLTMIAGRDFDADFPADTAAFVINKAMAAQMGWNPEEAVGQTLYRISDAAPREGTVIGVTADAHYASLHQDIQPLVFGHWEVNQSYAPIRIREGDVAPTLEFIESRWTAFQPGYPFRYFFLDDDYARFYERERRLGTLFSYFTVLAVLIACLGLFGLASFVTSQRTREIGVRKAMGASSGSIVLLLSREFTVLVLAACAFGFPVAWFAMSRWLQGFAYATDLDWSVFLYSGATALLVAWLTVGTQSIRAALSDPVRALHYE